MRQRLLRKQVFEDLHGLLTQTGVKPFSDADLNPKQISYGLAKPSFHPGHGCPISCKEQL